MSKYTKTIAAVIGKGSAKDLVQNVDRVHTVLADKKNWIKGDETRCDDDGYINSFCLIGAVREINGPDEAAAAAVVAAAVLELFPKRTTKDANWIGDPEQVITGFNDADITKHSDIVKVTTRAKKIARDVAKARKKPLSVAQKIANFDFDA